MKDSSSPAFNLKGSVLTLSVLQILTLDYSAFKDQLEVTARKNPKFFDHMPVLFDLQKIYSLDADVDFSALITLLRDNHLIPVGIINANPAQQAAAVAAGLGIMPKVKAAEKSESTSRKITQSKLVTQPIRSGQHLYAKDADLIILSSVSNGAEILADGHIHVYGTLRGRAIAGATGNTSARIFCHRLEAELVSIAGYYKIQDELSSLEPNTNLQIYLNDNQLMISGLREGLPA